jgi:hypothetical protein
MTQTYKKNREQNSRQFRFNLIINCIFFLHWGLDGFIQNPN